MDEAHCLWALCSHPSCWQAEERIRTGKPRMMKAPNSTKAPTKAAEGFRFPVLSVVNASEWTNIKKPFDVFSPKTQSVSKADGCILTNQPPSAKEAKRRETVQSSSGPTHLERNRPKKTVKIIPLDGSSVVSRSSEASVIWVPCSCHSLLHDVQQSVESPQLAVKKLICFPSHLDRSIDKKQKCSTSQPNRKRKGSQRSEVSMYCGLGQPSPDQDLKLKKTSAFPEDHHLVPADQTAVPAPVSKDGPRPPRSVRGLLLRNKPAVFHPSWERMQRRRAPDDLCLCKCRVDMKTEDDGSDWQHLKRQTYLWRKHNKARSYDHRGVHLQKLRH